MTIQTLYPDIKPTLNLDFANTEKLDGRITFTRASAARYYDGKTVAKAEENLLLQSQTLNTSWTLNRGTVAINTGDTNAPDGTATANKLTQNSGQTTLALFFPAIFNYVSGVAYTFSIFAKKGDKNYILISENVSRATGQNTWFNIDTGAVGTTAAAHTASIVNFGNGWYRCVITFTPDASRAGQVSFGGADTDNSTTVVDSGSTYLWGAQLEQRSSVTAYTATTTQPITNYIPVLLTATDNVARFDHNPTTGESLGLLVEEQRTNLLTYSSQFDDAAWTKTDASITANALISPDGTLTADKLVENTANATHSVAPGLLTFTSGVAYSLSVFAKVGERSTFLFVRSGPGGASARFNLSTLTATAIVGSPTVSIIAVGNGWYRCTMSWTADSTANRTHSIRLANPAGTESYTGDGYSGIFIWGAQLEAGAFPTSYIPTVASQVTRSADAASMTGANFSSWYSQGEGTVFVSARSVASSVFAFNIDDGTTANRIQFSISNATTVNAGVIVNNVAQADFFVAAVPANGYLQASAYKFNDFAISANGNTPSTDTSGVIPSVNRATIGSFGNNANILNGTIKKLAYYPKRLTNAQLQALTA